MPHSRPSIGSRRSSLPANSIPPEGPRPSRALTISSRAPSSRSPNENGEGGIRTLEAGISPPNALAGRRLQPLGHFSLGSEDTARPRHSRFAPGEDHPSGGGSRGGLAAPCESRPPPSSGMAPGVARFGWPRRASSRFGPVHDRRQRDENGGDDRQQRHHPREAGDDHHERRDRSQRRAGQHEPAAHRKRVGRDRARADDEQYDREEP